MREGKQKLARQEAAVARTKRMQDGTRGAAAEGSDLLVQRSPCSRSSSTSTMPTATAVCLSLRSSSTPKASFRIVVPQGLLFPGSCSRSKREQSSLCR